MRSFLVAAMLYGAVLAAPSCGILKCNHDDCLRAFIRHGPEGESLCSAYASGVAVPPVFESACDGDSTKISSACACMSRPTVTVTVPGSSVPSKASVTATTASVATSFSVLSSSTRTRTRTPHTSFANVTTTVPSTGFTSIASSTHITSSEEHTRSKHTHSTHITVPSASVTSSQHITTSESSTTSKVTTSSEATTSSKVAISSSQSKTTPSTSTTSPVSVPSACVCTDYAQVAPAVATCTSIRLQGIHVPSGSSLDLSKIKAGTTVTFAGTTTFDQTSSSAFEPIILGGSGVTITADPGAIIDGSGQLYWDGKGGNGGSPKPNHFIAANKLTSNSVISNLHIRNYPNRCFAITGCADLTIRSIVVDNSAGNDPNARSAGSPAAHNTDGFGVSSSTNIVITDSQVMNQDDCVAITSGDRITVRNMHCVGSHGLSIGSIGGKVDNTVTNVVFSDSTLTGAENGARIKSNYGQTGLVSNITFENLALDGVTKKGIIVQQDYLNGGPTGNPSNGVLIENVMFRNITGTVAGSGIDYYVLCGHGSCNNMAFEDVHISGGGSKSSCNFPVGGCPGA